MDKSKDRNRSDLDRALQGTWIVVAQHYCPATAGYEDSPDYSDGLASWSFKRGKAVYMDVAMCMRIDYTYRIEGDRLILHAVDTDAESPDEPEQYRVTITGKYAAFSEEENRDTPASLTELVKV